MTTDSMPSRTMVRRLAWALAAVACIALASAVVAAVGVLRDAALRQQRQLLSHSAASAAAILQARLAMADAIVHNAVLNDGANLASLHQRLAHTEAIGAVLTPGALPPGEIELAEADRAALAQGLTVLRTPRGTAAPGATYLLRAARGGGSPLLFELAPQWLWAAIAPADAAVHLAILDGAGALLHADAQLNADLLYLFTRERGVNAPGGAALTRSWQANGSSWSGAVAQLPTPQLTASGAHWSVVSYAPALGWAPAFSAFGPLLPPLLLVAALAVFLGTRALAARWEPLLHELRLALIGLNSGRYDRVLLGASADTPRLVATEFNATIAKLEVRMHSLATLEQIDRRLLESVEIEQSLDDVLEHICRLSQCDGASLVLLDRDARDHGRSFTAMGEAACRVSRTSLDPEWLEYLAENAAGVTVARPEPGRHDFLVPLAEAGAETFWVWPVKVQGEVTAILSIGFRGTPLLTNEIAKNGADCARRLAVALSNNARDEHLYRQAHYDALTSLPNRLLFRDRLAQELANAGAAAQHGALLYVDLDHFKKVNDTVGHSAGDQLLTIVAQRLRSCVKDGDTVARLGGDEFTVILRQVASPELCEQVANRIIAALQVPVHVGGRDHYVRASIGITMFPDDGNNIDELMRNTDLAMYRAKAGGRSRAVFYDSQMAQPPVSLAQSGLYRALRRREFSLYYQPQYALKDGRLVGLEALLRWQTPHDGMRYPAEFVPAAEASGVIVDIGAWVLEAACNQLAIWREQGVAPDRLALNVSAQQLRQPDFAHLVRRALDRVGVAPETLELELTESVLADEETRRTLKRLAALGVRLALDDFGTGYSALNYLRLHPVHTVKIDRSFLQEVPHSRSAMTLTESIIAMAHALDKQVVAEGVETAEQLDFLRERGCDFAQGFYLAHPRCTAEITEMLTARHAQHTRDPRQMAG